MKALCSILILTTKSLSLVCLSGLMMAETQAVTQIPCHETAAVEQDCTACEEAAANWIQPLVWLEAGLGQVSWSPLPVILTGLEAKPHLIKSLVPTRAHDPPGIAYEKYWFTQTIRLRL